jgi:hypothetical protein
VDHLRRGDRHLQHLLRTGRVVTHPFVVGEIACGRLANRVEVLTLLQALPQAPMATHEEILTFIERQSLHGRGLGLIDVHLVASARLSRLAIWTRDKNLNRTATVLRVAYRP